MVYMDMKNNVLIVEDHALTSFALKTSLSTSEFIENILEASSAKDALALVKENEIDLVVMDIGLPDIDGIEASRKIREIKPDVKIMVLSSHCEKQEVEQCLKIGISAYCTKDIQPQKLKEIIEDVLKGSLYFDSSIAKYVMQTNTQEEKNDETHVKDCYNLTLQEKRVLILLASGNNNSQIAKKLKISINTTKVHVCSILQKMEVEDRTQAAIKAIRENLII